MSESVIVQAGHGRAFRVPGGAALKVINPRGTQAVDTWAFHFGASRSATPLEFLSMEHTRSVHSTIFVTRGMQMMSSERRVMLTLIEDTSPGVHDTLLPACNAAIYRELGCPPDHRSCAANLREALAEAGLAVPFTPPPLNLFMNVPVGASGALDRLPPVARPGDYVVLRAEMDLVVVLSACPQDVTPINGAERKPTDIEVRIISNPPAA